MRGAPIRGVQELLGHSTIEMTMRYAHLSPNVTREIVGLLDGVGNNTGTEIGTRSQRSGTA
jgi:integrase